MCRVLLICLVVLVFGLPGTPRADEREPGQTGSAFSLRWENDAFGGNDENYTNGIGLALTQKGEGLLGGTWNIFNNPAGERFSTYDIGQLQYTPTEIGRTIPDPRDRPYAGLLYVGIGTSLRQDESLHGLKLVAGVVGPASLSEATQKLTHRMFGYNLPKGWGFQLKNEPVLNLLYEYRRKFVLTPRDSAVGFELIPVGGAMLGNLMIQAQAAAQFRLGYQLPDDFGSTALRGTGSLPFPVDIGTRRSWGAYVFAGGGASLVARDLTFDGNTFAQSRKVDKRPLVPAAEFGASFQVRRFQATFTYTMVGLEFYGQRVREDYGSVLLTYFFR